VAQAFACAWSFYIFSGAQAFACAWSFYISEIMSNPCLAPNVSEGIERQSPH